MRLHTTCSYFINVIIIVTAPLDRESKGEVSIGFTKCGACSIQIGSRSSDPYFLSRSLSDVSKSQKIVFQNVGPCCAANTPKSGPQWRQYTRADNFAKCRSIVKTRWLYTVSQKKQGTTILSITSPNVERFSNFFSLTDSLVNIQQNRH